MWFILALLAGLLFAVNKLISRAMFVNGVNPIAFLAVHDLLAGLLLVPLAILNFSLPHSDKTWLALILCVLFIFLANFFAALSLEKTEASLYQIAGQSRHVVVLFGAYFLFSEAVSLAKIISIILIVLGVGVALLNKSRLKLTLGINYAFVSAFFIGLAFLFVKLAAVDVKPAFLGSLGLIVSGLLAYGLLFVTKKRPSPMIPTGYRGQLVIAAAIFAVMELCLFTALHIGEASRVTPVTQSSVIFTLVGGYIFLSERANIKQKIIGCFLIGTGIGLLYFF